MISTPKHRGTLWVLANISLLAIVPAAALYFDRMQRAGAYPVEADSIGLPIMGIAMWVFILLVPLNVGWWFLLRRYPGKSSLFASGRGLNIGPRIVEVAGVLLAALFGVGALWALADGALEVTPVLLLWCYVAIAMRAAFATSARVTARL